ncbi:MAG: beta-hydroxyacyl-ACP dehydratase [Candidatus Magnetomorum sp.]|nr:beta-hydroxyacyl-ACP dehydratase [Candidatus Magnetomorum sp.]
MPVDSITIKSILGLIPQHPPFRYIDDIIHISVNDIVASYRFKEDEFFYKGHFPGNAITPGVILIETMAQTGVVALGIYQLMEQGNDIHKIKDITPLFSFVDKVEFTGLVRPGEKVMINAKKIYYRCGNIQSAVSIKRENGEPVCRGQLTGSGVRMNEK